MSRCRPTLGNTDIKGVRAGVAGGLTGRGGLRGVDSWGREAELKACQADLPAEATALEQGQAGDKSMLDAWALSSSA